nr:unnamed protein product [Callosobruchus analis]
MNIQSLRNKTLELEVALKTLNTDYQIICLSETWLKQEEVQFIKLEGFDIFLEVFERLGREVSARFINYKTIWAGDFNINLAPSVSNDSNKNKFLDLLHSLNYEQTIFDATRPSNCINNVKISCIDHFFPNFNNYLNNKVIQTVVSDHYSQSITITLENLDRGKNLQKNKVYTCLFTKQP